MDKKQIAHVLKEVGILLELKGENKFKTQAYANAARAVETFTGNVEALRTEKIRGVGKATQENIIELLDSGTLGLLDELRAEVPAGVQQMIRIKGLGAKKVRQLYEAGIETVDQLERACHAGRIAQMSGFGRKTQTNILEGIALLKQYAGKMRYDQALSLAEPLMTILQNDSRVDALSFMGSLRRRCEVVRDIDILIGTDDPAGLTQSICEHPAFGEVIDRSSQRIQTRLAGGQEVDLSLVAPERFPVALFYTTGHKTVVKQWQTQLEQAGLTLEWDQILQQGKPLLFANEAAIFNLLDLPYLPPEIREPEWTDFRHLPNLINAGDLRGVLHVHTTYSDGVHSVEEMAQAAAGLGYHYVGITDHSQSSTVANGMKPERVYAQLREIDRLNACLETIEILKGIECDILADGSLDYSDDLLAEFDFVIASVHTKFNMKEGEMTERIIRAMSNPYVRVLGHPTGRLLLQRESYPVNLEAVIDAAAEYHVALELNANPRRLDLDWRWLRKATERGVKILIGPDAHRMGGLTDTTQYGIPIARKGGLRKDDVLNCFTLEHIRAFFKR